MGELSIVHWVVVLLIVVIVFGAGKIKHIGSDLGQAIRNFKHAMNEGESEKKLSEENRKISENKKN